MKKIKKTLKKLFKKQKKENDFALKLQAEMLVIKSLLLKTSLIMLSQNDKILKTLKSSCLEELEHVKLIGLNEADQQKFLNYAELTIEDLFSRIYTPDENKIETFH